MSEPIVFYDIPSKLPGKLQPWSPNTWNTRYALNFKGIPYKTEWVEYPDIEPLCLKIGASATDKKDDGRPHYTLPVIYDPNTKAVIADSFQIALYLDKQYPQEPKLFPQATQALVQSSVAAWAPIRPPTLSLALEDIWKILNEPSAVYFRETREKTFATKLEDISPEGSEEKEKLWKALETGLKAVGEWMDLTDGPYVMGTTASYADLVLAARLIWVKRCWSGARGGDGENSKDWDRLSGIDGGRWKEFAALFEKYEQVL